MGVGTEPHTNPTWMPGWKTRSPHDIGQGRRVQYMAYWELTFNHKHAHDAICEIWWYVVSYTTLSLGTTAIKGSMHYGLIVPVCTHTRCCTTTITCPTSLLILVEDADERYIGSDFSNVQTSERKACTLETGSLD